MFPKSHGAHFSWVPCKSLVIAFCILAGVTPAKAAGGEVTASVSNSLATANASGESKAGALCLNFETFDAPTLEKELDAEVLRAQLAQAIQAAALPVAPGRHAITGRVSDIRVDICWPYVGFENTDKIKGTVSLAMNWDVAGAVVTTSASHTRKKSGPGGVRGLLLLAYAENLRQLVGDSGLHAALATPANIAAPIVQANPAPAAASVHEAAMLSHASPLPTSPLAAVANPPVPLLQAAPMRAAPLAPPSPELFGPYAQVVGFTHITPEGWQIRWYQASDTTIIHEVRGPAGTIENLQVIKTTGPGTLVMLRSGWCPDGVCGQVGTVADGVAHWREPKASGGFSGGYMDTRVWVEDGALVSHMTDPAPYGGVDIYDQYPHLRPAPQRLALVKSPVLTPAQLEDARASVSQLEPLVEIEVSKAIAKQQATGQSIADANAARQRSAERVRGFNRLMGSVSGVLTEANEIATENEARSRAELDATLAQINAQVEAQRQAQARAQQQAADEKRRQLAENARWVAEKEQAAAEHQSALADAAAAREAQLAAQQQASARQRQAADAQRASAAQAATLGRQRAQAAVESSGSVGTSLLGGPKESGRSGSTCNEELACRKLCVGDVIAVRECVKQCARESACRVGIQ